MAETVGSPFEVVAGPLGRLPRSGIEIPAWRVAVFPSLYEGPRAEVFSFQVAMRDVPDDGDVFDVIDARLEEEGGFRRTDDAPRPHVIGSAGVHMWTVWRA